MKQVFLTLSSRETQLHQLFQQKPQITKAYVKVTFVRQEEKKK